MTKEVLIGLALVVLSGSVVQADIDWRAKGAVTPVKNQGQGQVACNLSWAFAITGVVEGASAIRGATLSSLSEQELVDCASSCGESEGPCPDSGCAPLTCGFSFVAANGLCSESSYPYTARPGACRQCTATVASGIAANWIRLAGESALIGALNSGPILARLEIGENGTTLASYLNYHGGVFVPPPTDATVVQWVVIVGYTSQYFIVKNSLGTSWGSNGYVYLVRGRNALGVNNLAYALQAGPATVGACTLPDQSCVEVGPSDCSMASGTFSGLGTFCSVPCAAAVGRVAPTLSPIAIPVLVLLLTLTGLLQLPRRARPARSRPIQ